MKTEKGDLTEAVTALRILYPLIAQLVRQVKQNTSCMGLSVSGRLQGQMLKANGAGDDYLKKLETVMRRIDEEGL